MKPTHTKLALAVLFAGLVMTSLGASAQVWSAAPDTCAVDEDSLPYYVFGAGPLFTMKTVIWQGSHRTVHGAESSGQYRQQPCMESPHLRLLRPEGWSGNGDTLPGLPNA